MEGFKSLSEAVNYASAVADSWIYGSTGEKFSLLDLLTTANWFDSNYPVGAGSYFITFPDGEIALMSTADLDVIPLFTPENRTEPEPVVNEPPAPQKTRYKFCPACGTAVSGGRFCRKCGRKLD